MIISPLVQVCLSFSASFLQGYERLDLSPKITGGLVPILKNGIALQVKHQLSTIRLLEIEQVSGA